eukprot:TRINITY_DN23279_c0_g1_i1.p1 TRINITY_DN23279_c0_g1~~TRINITY_DN23279_c0_g1_i1.p1  ORF type:complete len:394 (+),score=90.79 TRINITY_DN23279_c0_g1_i1:125-1306(+)
MSWYSWWTGSLRPKARSDQPISDSKNHNVALVVGITGIVGQSLAEILPSPGTLGGPWKVYGIARRPKPKWSASNSVEYVQCDVMDREETLEKVSELKDVTHLFWVVWAKKDSNEECCEANGRMLTNVLDALLPNAENLQHISLQTGSKHYLGPSDTDADQSKFKPHEPPFHEDMPRLPVPNFYYTLEDIVFEFAKKKQGMTWSIHRPGIILGFSPCAVANFLRTLCVYAAICKHEGLPFKFPGNEVMWEGFLDFSDANLIAEQEIWACVAPEGKNQAFNCANGDVFRWKLVWEMVAEKFDLEVPAYDGKGFSITEAIQDKVPVWDAIVKKNDLEPSNLFEVGSWWAIDYVANFKVYLLHSMNKSKECEFFGFRDTKKCLEEWINKLKAAKIVP